MIAGDWKAWVFYLPLLSTAFPGVRHDLQPVLRDQIALGSSNSKQTLRLAVFGDSWASGINFGPPSAKRVEYDYPDSSEVCRCRRVNEAWPAQVLHDNGTLARKYNLELDYQACYGSWFKDVFDQVERLNQTKTPDVAFLMIGGNPGGFPKIVEDCVFQYDRGKDYGPEFPDPNGTCYKTLETARHTVHSVDFITRLLSSVYAILNEPRIARKPHFRLFVVSYNDLFNHEDTACNNMTFGIWGGKQPMLSRELRVAIDSIIDEGRQLYDLYLNHLIPDRRLRFIDANAALAGHRFCEPTANGTMTEMLEEAWLYALEWLQCIPYVQAADELEESRSILPGFCRNCGGFAGLGDFQRPFHPKERGHQAYKDLILKVLETEIAEGGI